MCDYNSDGASMKLRDISGRLFTRAATIYLRQAYKDHAIPMAVSSRLDWIARWESLSDIWNDQHFEVVGDDGAKHFFLRLGSWVYPHMKLGVVECQGVSGEYVFVADTHDRHFVVDQHAPDFEQFQRIKRCNELLKTRIEKAWKLEGIPTALSLTGPLERFLVTRPVSEGREQVLIVDDTPATLTVEKVILEKNGFNVVACDSGAGAIEAAKKYNFDAGVFDIMMPDLNGYELVESLARQGLKNFPIAFSSAMMSDQVKMDDVEGYIQKPFAPRFFIEKVEKLLLETPFAMIR